VEEQVYVVCVGEHDPHIKQSILTHCDKCGAKVWVSITNCDRKPICMPCVIKIKEAEFYITPETLKEAMDEINNMEEGNG